MLDEWFGQKAPKLPANAKEWIIKAAPYFAILAVIVTIPAIFVILGLGMFSYGYGYGYGMMRYGYGGMMGGTLWPIFSIVILVLYALSINGLFKRNASGWNYSFYAVLVGGLQNLLSFNIGGLIIGLLLGFYILFQIKPFYFGGVSMMNPPKPNTPPQRPQV